jgi:hypothetical protein
LISDIAVKRVKIAWRGANMASGPAGLYCKVWVVRRRFAACVSMPFLRFTFLLCEKAASFGLLTMKK